MIALDNLSTGHPRNIAHLLGNQRFRFIQYDVTDYIYVDGPLDVIFHLASLPSPVDYLRKPIQTLKVGALGHAQGARPGAREEGARCFSPRPRRCTATRSFTRNRKRTGATSIPVGPRGVYDESKRFAEAMTMAYQRYHGVATRDLPDLQHLRPAHAARRRARGHQLRRSGAARRAADGLRRRLSARAASATSAISSRA